VFGATNPGAELALMSQLALGSSVSSLASYTTLEDLIDLYSAEFVHSPANGSWLGDLPAAEAAQAMLDLAEAYSDRYALQVSSLGKMAGGGDPLWTFVTGYYAAFFGAHGVMAACGRPSVKLRLKYVLPALSGNFGLSVAGSSRGPDWLEVLLTPLNAKSAHLNLWVRLEKLLNDALAVDPDRVGLLLGTYLLDAIRNPRLLSESRNLLNYRVMEHPPFRLPAVTLLSPSWPDEAALVAWTTTAGPLTEYRRPEFAAIALGSVGSWLRRELVARGGRVDKRRTAFRRAHLPHQYLA
jgi:hypothetical protein